MTYIRLLFHNFLIFVCFYFSRYHLVLNLSTDATKQTQVAEAALASASTSVAVNATAEKKRKADLVAQRKARIMAKMAAMQQSFIKTNETLFEVN